MRKAKILFTLMAALFAIENQVQAQSGAVTLSGTVTDVEGAPLPAITVYEESRLSNGTVTDESGAYSLKVPENAVVIFSALGYVEVREKIAGRKVINVVLKEDNISLEASEVVSVGYGTVAKRDLTGSVAQVDIDELRKAPVVNFDQAIQGRVSGVVVSTADGEVGSTASIIIRGNNSLTQSNEPLYVIDGFPSESSYATSISPSDIASIDILKDASATAIYGARGANGVVVITTKSGQEGKPTVSFSSSLTSSKITGYVELMDAYEFAKLQEDIHTTRGMSSPYTDGVDDQGNIVHGYYSPEDYRNIDSIDWQKMIYRTAWTQNYNVSVSGGNRNSGTRYIASASLLDNSGIIINSNFKRYQGRLGLVQTLGSKLEMDFRLNYSRTAKSGVSPTEAYATGTSSAYLLYSVWGYRPTTPIRYGKTSEELVNSLIDEDNGVVIDSRFNPVKSVQNEHHRNIRDYVTANLALTYTIAPALKLKISGGWVNYNDRKEEFNNSQTSTGNVRSSSGRGVNGAIYWTKRDSWVNENTLTFDKVLKRNHRLNAVVGVTFQGENIDYQGVRAFHMTTEALGLNGMHTGDYQTVTPYERDWTLMSYLARVNYSYKYKYYLTASFRSDGSSKFPSDNRWAYFPSVSAAWNFNREEALKQLSWLSNGKLRFSWGQTGNNRTSTPYDYYAIITTSPGVATTFDYVIEGANAAGYYSSNMANEKLKWETTAQTDLGLDLGFWDNRVKLTVDLYHKTTRNLLLNATLPGSSGYRTAMINIGSLRNRGLEISLDMVPLRKKNFEWDVNFNIAFNRNKVLALTNNQDVLMTTVSWDSQFASQYAYTTQIGKPAGLMYGFIYEGTYKPEDFDGSGLLRGIPYLKDVGHDGVREGYPRYADINGDGVVDDKDRTVIGCGLPIHTGGFSSSFHVYNFDLNIFFSWSYGNDILNANRLVFENGYRYNLNQFASLSNRYRAGENTTSDIPCAYAQGIEYYSSRVVEDGSYLRLKTLSLGYNVPDKVMKKYGMSGVRIYISGENIWKWTNYSGADPEVSTRGSILSPGFDWAAYPRSFGLTAGLSLNF